MSDEADSRAFWDHMQRTTGSRSSSWDTFSATFEVCGVCGVVSCVKCGHQVVRGCCGVEACCGSARRAYDMYDMIMVNLKVH